MDTSNDEHRQLQADYGIPPPPAPQLPVPPPPFADFDFTFTPGPVPQMSSFSELQSLHSQSMLATTPHGSFDASGIFDFNFGSSAAPHGGGDFSTGGGPPGSNGVPPLLLSSTEETSLLGFLDKFGGDGFEFGPVKGMPEYPKHLDPPGVSGQGGTNSSHHGGLGLDVHPLQMHQSSSSTASGQHHGTPTTISPHETSNFNVNAFALRPHSSSFSQPPPPTPSIPAQTSSSPREVDPSPRPSKRRKSSVTDSASKDADQGPPTPGSSAASKAARKPLLTEPQKRWNHIQSEQRRRTVIKENFSTLETLVAADKRYKGPHPTLPVPLDANGKPKKGVRAKSLRGKGKMGTLFRAAEFIAYLEEGVDALSLEVERLEAAAATYQQQQHQMQVQGQNAMTGVVHYPLR